MTIVCGTDFTPNGNEAARIAARIATAMHTDLLLLHVFELAGAENVLLGRPDDPTSLSPVRALIEEEAARQRKRLDDEAQKLAQYGAKVKSELTSGAIDEAIVHRAERANADLVVVGALGRRTPSSWALGSHSDRVAQRSKRPVLVVRNGTVFDAWLGDGNPLRVLVAVDGSPTSDAAVAWTARLAALGPCEVIGAHVYWPPDRHERANTRGNDARSLPIGRGHADVESALASELRARLSGLPNGDAIELKLVGGLGRPADHLVQIACDEKVQLAVVGNHQRTGLGRMWHGSVSRGVIDLAPCSVACVPSATKT